jgi:hypothetical protein
MEIVGDTRSCDQCGRLFTPRREHGRFCSARCRVAWNGGKQSDPAAEVSALQWSITAMNDTARRLPDMRPRDRPRAFEVIAETVWQVTIVDATLVRYHPDAYDAVMATWTATERRQIEGTLGGLRFVRNRMRHETDHADFICPVTAHPGPDDGPVTAWTWKPVAEPGVGSLSPRGQEWELARYQAYQECLAGRAVGETFVRATAFLRLAAARAAAAMAADRSEPAPR